MKWFRSKIKTGSRLALFALAIQLVLSCGHFHGIAAAHAGPAVQSDLAVTPPLDAEPHQPAGHDDDHPPACAVCAVISLANNFLFAAPPHLDAPLAARLLHFATGAEFAHLGSLHPAFQSRAPPVS